MVTFLITSLFVLAFLAVAIYFWQKPAPSETEFLLPPPEGRGLFAGDVSESQTTDEHKLLWKAQRAEIVTRAQAGEKSALPDAKNSKDPSLYNEVLSALTAGAEGPQLLSLLSYLSRHDLPINSEAAEKFIQFWKGAPNRNSTAEMLHVAAVSDDARTYRIAVEAALQCWTSGHLADVSAPELRSIIDGEFWILSSQTRSSGAGFLLKQSLAEARRTLEAETQRNLPT
ncbi:MAG: hypothetical protein ACREBG_06645 [Pyrinomonadaceae bacterium]